MQDLLVGGVDAVRAAVLKNWVDKGSTKYYYAKMLYLRITKKRLYQIHVKISSSVFDEESKQKTYINFW